MTIPNRAGSGAHAAKLRPLTTALKAHRERWIADHPGQEAPGEIVLQANAGVAFAIIKQVMNACQGAGFPDVVFAAAPRP